MSAPLRIHSPPSDDGSISRRLRSLRAPRLDRIPQPRQALALARLVHHTDQWRLYPDLADNVRYVDIETLGLAPDDAITMVSISDGYSTTTLVSGVDLCRERLERLLEGAGLLVSFNGVGFDVPRLKRAFPGLHWDLPHFDLAIEGRRVGLRGGLKRVERRLGYTRPRTLQGVDGAHAVSLWREHMRGDAGALRRLIRYNRADVESLVFLADRIYDRLERQAEEGSTSAGWLRRG